MVKVAGENEKFWRDTAAVRGAVEVLVDPEFVVVGVTIVEGVGVAVFVLFVPAVDVL